jgi:hypothetical protein
VVAAFESLGHHCGDHFDSATRLDSRGKADPVNIPSCKPPNRHDEIENPVGTDQINQTHALEIRLMFHRNPDEGKNDAGFML